MQKITTPQKALIQGLFLVLFAVLMADVALADPEDDARAAYLRKDYAAALKIVESPAIKGEAWAQHNLGVMYVNGQGMVKNDTEAVKWFRLAAQQGNAKGQHNLGVMYSNGSGVVQDYAEAVKWYQLAAQQGNTLAQFNLGVMHHYGRGVVQDYVKAHSWYNLAAVESRGSDAGQAANAANSRDTMAKLMTPQQIGDAQK